jgi:conjugal transfer pilin signal peptidase TrbI
VNGLEIEPKFGLRVNASDSLPYSLFIGVKADPKNIKRSTIVSFSHSQVEGILAKRVSGLSGDTIRIEDDEVYVGDLCIGEVYRITPSGRILSPIQEQTIPEGYVFVSGQHSQSYDSRYAEFGLIKLEDIKDVLWPIF